MPSPFKKIACAIENLKGFAKQQQEEVMVEKMMNIGLDICEDLDSMLKKQMETQERIAEALEKIADFQEKMFIETVNDNKKFHEEK